MTISRKRNPLDRWLLATQVPVFLVGADRKLLYFNTGCEQLTGFRADDVLGQTCQYASQTTGPPEQTLLGTICPPPAAFAGEELQQAAYILPKHGAALPRLIHYFPLRESPKTAPTVLGVISSLRTPAATTSASPVLQHHATLAALRGSLRQRFQEQHLVADGPVMQKILEQISLAIPSRCGVLLCGEHGTGKEHLARVIHYSGPLKQHWFVPLDCSKLDTVELTSVFERLLDVHAGEAAASGKPQPGTIYLAAIEKLPRELQSTLARTLTQATKDRPLALRFLAGTTLSEPELWHSQTLQPDLAALLSPLTISIPPVRQRAADFPLLIQSAVEDLNRQRPTQLSGVSPEALRQLQRYEWPGNLDELQLVIQEAATVCKGTQIEPGDLPFRFRTAVQAQSLPPPHEPRPLPLDEMLLHVERNAILLALERCKSNKSQAADVLGINRARLYRRMEQLGIEDRGPQEESRIPKSE